eukprot:9352430-Karenia_brevis.AAC.1
MPPTNSEWADPGPTGLGPTLDLSGTSLRTWGTLPGRGFSEGGLAGVGTPPSPSPLCVYAYVFSYLTIAAIVVGTAISRSRKLSHYGGYTRALEKKK